MSEQNTLARGVYAAVHLEQWTPILVQQEIGALKDKPGAMLPILHAIQDRFGYVPKEVIPIIA